MADISAANNFATAAQQGLSAASAPSDTPKNAPRDKNNAETDPQFGDVLKRIQSQYGAKAEKPREIKKTLGKDDFLKIMITQMKHQDPTSPFKAEQMAAEMAQFTSVEQLQNMNQSLQKMTAQNSSDRMVMTSLIGKTVTVDKDRFPHLEGQNEALTYTLPRDAKSTHIALISETGEVVLEKDVGPAKKGDNVFQWDGLKSNTLPSKAGNYILRVEAKDEHDNPIPTDPRAKAQVIGVSFEGTDPVLLVGDTKNPTKITMKSVVRVELDSPPAFASPSARQAGSATSAQESGDGGKPSFIAFKKGEGSSTLDPSTASPEVAAALAQYGKDANALAKPEFRPIAQTGARAGAQPGSENAAPENREPVQKGFPNGLQD
jgi:flagellar basal-body rod modification protein FlgD